MLLSFAVKLCGWFFAFDFCVYGFEVDPLRLWLYGWLFAVRVLRSGFCGLFVCVLLGNGDYAGGELHTAAFVFSCSDQAKYRLVSCHF